jgi:hypothetical protein
MAQLRKRETSDEAAGWVHDPMARLLFRSGPPLPAQQGLMPPFPFESLDAMRAAWLEVRSTLLPEFQDEAGDGTQPWAEREWGAG